MGHRGRGLSWRRATVRSAAVTLSVTLLLGLAGAAGVLPAGAQQPVRSSGSSVAAK
jgi:hypothetical protein